MHQISIIFRGPGKSIRFTQGCVALRGSPMATIRSAPVLSPQPPWMPRGRQVQRNSPLGGSGPGGCDPALDAVDPRSQVGLAHPGRGGSAARSAAAHLPAGRGGRAAPAPPAAPCPGRAEPSRLCRRLRGISGANRLSAADPEAGLRPGRAGAVRRRRRVNPRHGRRRWRGPSPLGGAGSAETGGFAAGNPRPGSGGQGRRGVPGPVTDWRLRRHCVTPLPREPPRREPRCPAAPPRQGASGRPAPPPTWQTAPGGWRGRQDGPERCLPPPAAAAVSGRALQAAAGRALQAWPGCAVCERGCSGPGRSRPRGACGGCGLALALSPGLSRSGPWVNPACFYFVVVVPVSEFLGKECV